MNEFMRQVIPVDGHQHVVARFFAPAGEPRAAVLVVPAMGVTQAFYAPFAQWLATQGFLAATFDYRGIGHSRHGSLRKVGDLPRGVMEQWRRWCLDPEYAVGVEGESARDLYAAVDTPIVSLSFTDDEFMSLRNIESIHSQYANALRTMKRIAPKEIGEKRIGHFGFFKPKFEHSLWHAHLLPELT